MPNPTPVSVVLNPPNTPALISEFVINAPLIVQTINIKNKLDSLDSTMESLSQRVLALEAVVVTLNSTMESLSQRVLALEAV